MNPTALQSTAPLTSAGAGFAALARGPAAGENAITGDVRSDFAGLLARSQSANSASPEQRARDGAQQFVAIAFVQPILAQLRQTNSAAPPFAPSAAERQFQSLFDGQIAQQIVRASHFPLVDRIASDLLKRTSEPTAGPADEGRPAAISTENRK